MCIESIGALYTIRFNYSLSQNTSIVPSSLISKTIDYSIGMRAMNILRDISIKLSKLSGVCFLFPIVNTCTKVVKCKGVSYCVLFTYF